MSIFKVIDADGVVYEPNGPGSAKRVAVGELLILDDRLNYLVGTQIGKHQVQRIDPAAFQNAIANQPPEPKDSNGGIDTGKLGPNPANADSDSQPSTTPADLPAAEDPHPTAQQDPEASAEAPRKPGRPAKQ